MNKKNFISFLLALIFCVCAVSSSFIVANASAWDDFKDVTSDVINSWTRWIPKVSIENNTKNYLTKQTQSWQPSVNNNWSKDSDGKTNSFTVSDSYYFIGKRGFVYPNGDYEIITFEFNWSGNISVSDSETILRYNYIKFTRENISTGVTSVTEYPVTSFTYTYGTYADYKGICLNIRFYVDNSVVSRSFWFCGSDVNDIRITNCSKVLDFSNLINSNYTPIGSDYNIARFCYFTTYGSTNNSDVYYNFYNVYVNNNYGSFPVFLNPVSTGTVINTTNYLNYSNYGFDLDVDGNLVLNPEIALNGYVDSIFDSLIGKFELFYSNQPAPGDTFVNNEGDTYNYITIYQDDNDDSGGDSGGGYGYGDVNVLVTVDVNATLPSEWLGDYPELDTTPDIIIDEPDMFELVEGNGNGAEFPASLTSTVSGYFVTATDFLVSTGLYRLMLFFIVLGIFWKFTGG